MCATAGTAGDPLFTGFDGRVFDFTGSAGNVYNILTEKSHQLNAAFVDAEIPSHQGSGTFIEGVSMMFKHHRLQTCVDASGHLDLMVDQVDIAPGEVASWDGTGLTATLLPDSSSATFATPLLVWTVHGRAPSVVADELWKAHIDLQVSLRHVKQPRHVLFRLTVVLSSSTGPTAICS